MTPQAMIFLAVGLSLDASAAAAACSAGKKGRRILNALETGLVFGLFQGTMTLLGWLLGGGVYVALAWAGRAAAFCILLTVAIRMIIDGVSKEYERPPQRKTGARLLVAQGFATSVDAFAAGVALHIADTGVAAPSLIIGGVTFLLSSLFAAAGQSVGAAINRWASILGGAALLSIAVKTLLTG